MKKENIVARGDLLQKTYLKLKINIEILPP